MDVCLYGTDDGSDGLPRPLCAVGGEHRWFNEYHTHGCYGRLASHLSDCLESITAGIGVLGLFSEERSGGFQGSDLHRMAKRLTE
jgi:hypothetical protein